MKTIKNRYKVLELSDCRINESVNTVDDTTPEILLTYGSGPDHGHISLTIDDCILLKSFLEKFIDGIKK